MGSGKKRRGAEVFRGNRRALIEAVLVLGLLAISLAAYLVFRDRPPEGDALRVRDRTLRQAIFQYRLEAYERAELLLRGSLESAPRREKSLALLYLGNIAYRRGRYPEAVSRYLEAHRLDRKTPHALYNAALASCREGRWTQARELAGRAVDADPSFGPALLLLANLSYGAGRVAEAERLYAGALEFSPLARYNLARCRSRSGYAGSARGELLALVDDPETPRALRGLSALALAELTGGDDPAAGAEYLGRALEVFPSVTLRYNRAALLTAAGRYREAERLLASVQPEEGIAPTWRLLLNVTRYLNGRYGESLRGFEELLEAGDRELARVVGDVYVKMEDFQQAERMYRQALLVKADPDALGNLVRLQIRQKRFREALELASDFARRYEGPEGHLFMGEVYFSMGMREQGLQAMRLARERAESTGQHLEIARVFTGAGMPDNALEVLASLGDERARLALAGLYRRTGHLDRASRVLERLRLRTADPDIHYRATLLLASLSDPAASLELYRELMADFPYRYRAYHNAALALMRREDFAGAAAMVRDCIAACPDLRPSILSDLYVVLGAAQFYGGDPAAATRSFRQAAQLDPESDLPGVNLGVIGHAAGQQDKRL